MLGTFGELSKVAAEAASQRLLLQPQQLFASALILCPRRIHP